MRFREVVEEVEETDFSIRVLLGVREEGVWEVSFSVKGEVKAVT